MTIKIVSVAYINILKDCYHKKYNERTTHIKNSLALGRKNYQ